MGVYALEMHTKESAFRAAIIVVGATGSFFGVRWLNRKEKSEAISGTWPKWRRRIAATSIGILPVLAPHPYGAFAFLDANMWGAAVHSLIQGRSPTFGWWNPRWELFMFYGNPGFYSGLITGYLIQRSGWDILWGLAPGLFLLTLGVVSGGQPLEQFKSLGPTLITMYGPHALMGHAIGARIWNYCDRKRSPANNG